MPITINGTTVTTNRINGTAINSETVNGTQVYGGVSRVWYWFGEQSSEPSYTPYYHFMQGAYPDNDEYVHLLTDLYPPANIPVGTIGWVYSSFTGQFNMLMVIEE